MNLDPILHRALRLEAAATDRSISELVDDAVRAALAADAADAADAEDLALIDARRREPRRSFEAFVADLEHRGRP